MLKVEPISRKRVKVTAKKQLKEHFKKGLQATWPIILFQLVKTGMLAFTVYMFYKGLVLSRSGVHDSGADLYFSRTVSGALGLLVSWSAKWSIIDAFQKPDRKLSWASGLQGFSFKVFFPAFLLAFVQKILLFFWSFLTLPALVKMFSYSQTYYAYKMDLLFDRKQNSLTDYITISRRVMSGRKRELFLLELSFIGWHLVGIMTLGLAYIWITPYINTCRVVYSTQVFSKAIEGVLQ